MVRDARAADALAVARVHVRAWQVGYRGLLDQDSLDSLRPEDRAARYRFDAEGATAPRTMVAEAAPTDAIVGFATCGQNEQQVAAREGELLALYVDPNRWGSGVGRLLIGEVRARLAARGCTTAVLWMLVGNTRAERFYRADGWQPDGAERKHVIWGITVHDMRFRRPLP